MDWDQIENKWAAMTRRVRGDLTPDSATPKTTPKTQGLRQGTRTDTRLAAIAERPPAPAVDAGRKLSAE
ncbi:hypothetical protein G5B31_18705 [Rhodobacter sp. SGA-6-6]|uniref:hypothetical protein n=1 Tax=Rhodobacter sp. SGA-6-6 TaxID=2710882 RepID=UPI0013EBE41E|nr:hypothetical protein [Rhodobacter sp. SGA-6-6]NGM47572.1 hypothetical protein [Rhodobacter sp. SGA-6-6]